MPLDADSLATALQNGVHRVIRAQETLNRINVFPVADGDTGTNLAVSLGASLAHLARPASDHLGTFLEALADILLDSARGNSGAIMAQFFQGFSDSAAELKQLGTEELAAAVRTGSDYAHDAIANPHEGTILTVIAAFALRLEESANRNASLAETFDKATHAARKALAGTESQLEVLRKAGVVDAGAKGFVEFVEGMAEFIIDGKTTEAPDLLPSTALSEPVPTEGTGQDLAFRFCTECIINGDGIDRRKLREGLSALGDSLVLAGTRRKAKIHIHTNDPESVFDEARRHGTLGGIKADDMHRQQHSTHDGRMRFAVITDSAADIPDEELDRLDIHMVPCRVEFGDRGYLDKVSISTTEFFNKLAESPEPPTTSQPSPGDFRRQYQYLASHFPDVLSINLTQRVSGTFQAAKSAAARTRAGGKVHVIDSRNASLGQGQLAVFAAECAQAGLDIEATLAAVESMISLTTTYALIRDLSYAVRGGRVPASRKRIADWLRLTPVIQTRPDGTLSASGLLPGRRNLLRKFARYIAKRCNADADLRLAVAHAVCEADAETLRSELHALLPNIGGSTVTEMGSALGAHGGPGSIVVGVQEYRDPASFR